MKKIAIVIVILALLIIAASRVEHRTYLPVVVHVNGAVSSVSLPTPAPTQNPLPGVPTPTPVTICIPGPCD